MRRVFAVVPAHNESQTVAETVRALIALPAEVLVVADCCTDDTAERAREAGATVLVREGRGDKSRALAKRLAVGSGARAFRGRHRAANRCRRGFQCQRGDSFAGHCCPWRGGHGYWGSAACRKAWRFRVGRTVRAMGVATPNGQAVLRPFKRSASHPMEDGSSAECTGSGIRSGSRFNR